MLSRSQAKVFFLGGTAVVSAVFVWLTIDTFQRIPEQTGSDAMTAEVVRGKHLFDQGNCMGCHTLLGEGGYYAPELTKVYERRGPNFIQAMLKDPQSMYPGERRMYEYDYTDEQIADLIAFFEWIGKMDLNGFPPEPLLFPVATAGTQQVAKSSNRPKVFNQMCIACHALGGQGGSVGPALDGVGDRMSKPDIMTWLENPQAVRPGTTMPNLPLSAEDIKELGAFLSTLRASPSANPPPAEDGPFGSREVDPHRETPSPGEGKLAEGRASARLMRSTARPAAAEPREER